MIRIQYDVFVSNHYHFDDYAGVDSGGRDDDLLKIMMATYSKVTLFLSSS